MGYTASQSPAALGRLRKTGAGFRDHTGEDARNEVPAAAPSHVGTVGRSTVLIPQQMRSGQQGSARCRAPRTTSACGRGTGEPSDE